jgi:hypothetical protein
VGSVHKGTRSIRGTKENLNNIEIKIETKDHNEKHHKKMEHSQIRRKMIPNHTSQEYPKNAALLRSKHE